MLISDKSYPDAARRIDQRIRFGQWTQPLAKKAENGTKNFKDLNVNLDPDDEAYPLILKQVGLVGDNSRLKHESMRVVGLYFGLGNRGQKFCHAVWGMIEPERQI